MKEKLFKPSDDEEINAGGDYVEVASEGQREGGVAGGSKVMVRPFVMEEFEDVKEILDVLRTGSTIALINIRPLKDKDLVELKRAISKIRKTCEAIDGDIAGFGEDYVVVAPYFARIHRNVVTSVSED
jgi:SepF-like predicted cell division protein (DUF552 family)